MIFVLTQGGPVNATMVLSLYTYKTAFEDWDFGLASAVGTVWLVLLMGFALVYVHVALRKRGRMKADAIRSEPKTLRQPTERARLSAVAAGDEHLPARLGGGVAGDPAAADRLDGLDLVQAAWPTSSATRRASSRATRRSSPYVTQFTGPARPVFPQQRDRRPALGDPRDRRRRARRLRPLALPPAAASNAILMFFMASLAFPIPLLMISMYLMFVQLRPPQHLSGLVIGHTVITLPVCVWLLKNFFDQLPVEVEEAAYVDGAEPRLHPLPDRPADGAAGARAPPRSSSSSPPGTSSCSA